MKNWITILFLIFGTSAFSQITNTIRGVITDEFSGEPLIGANVVITSLDPIKGTVSDFNGEFRLDSVPIGRHDLVISYIGYAPKNYANIELNTGKEMVLSVKMLQLSNELEGVEVKANNANETLNKLATNSSVSFSVEEAQRYAGSLNDVSRMAQNFAGVQGADDSRNDIIIRGNSPSGVLYRLGGLDIPNPNHFARFGTTGGPVSMLNTNVLDKSDFFTGAFPAEYGNALAGVFDLNLRRGNNKKFEFLFQIGFNGLEGMFEGPFSKKSKASFLINYRYSTLGLFKLMGINFGTTAVPNYQDMNFNITIPTKKGVTRIFGLGGISKIQFIAKELSADGDLFANGGEDTYFKSLTGVAGLSHKHRLGNSNFIELIVGVQAAANSIHVDTVDLNFENPFRTYGNNTMEGKQTTSFHYGQKLSSKHYLKTGIYFDVLFYNLQDSVFQGNPNDFLNLRNTKGASALIQPYIEYQYKPTNRINLNFGLHYQHLLVGNQWNIEPRFGFDWKVNESNKLSLAYGYHSQTAPLALYFLESTDSLGNTFKTNTDVKFMKSHHVVLGYELFLKWGIHLKLEGYYQYIHDALVEEKSSSYSLINLGAAFDDIYRDSLTNNGFGYNVGGEITVEKRMQNGLYFLVNSSIFNSEYKASDGVWRNTAFNGNFTVNILGGYEWRLKQKKEFNKKGKPNPKVAFTFDTKVVMNGGGRYTEILLAESIAAGEEVRDYNNSFAKQWPLYFKWNFRLGFKMIGKKVTQEWAVDFQNMTNRKNVFNYEYLDESQSIRYIYQTGFLPIVQYRILF
ncbi:MAG: TonB-dependent receptor [Crocinitomicaceae bacterium]|nr:TonB-dependent receptor [Crocinitomicaceae bacterium]